MAVEWSVWEPGSGRLRGVDGLAEVFAAQATRARETAGLVESAARAAGGMTSEAISVWQSLAFGAARGLRSLADRLGRAASGLAAHTGTVRRVASRASAVRSDLAVLPGVEAAASGVLSARHGAMSVWLLGEVTARCVAAWAMQTSGGVSPASPPDGLVGVTARIRENLSTLNGLAAQRQAADEALLALLSGLLPAGPTDQPPGGGGRGGGGKRDNRRRGNPTGPGAPGDPADGTPGGAPFPGGLGDGVPGAGPITWPEPPAWTPPDADSGQWGSRDATLADRAWQTEVALAATAASAVWPDAARNLLHYLQNSGTTLAQDVDKMIADMPPFNDKISGQEARLGTAAIAKAKAMGATGPVTFPICIAWQGFYVTDNKDWFYATGGFSFNLTGQVTVYPPSTPGGQWRYEETIAVNYRDRYNWDALAGKSVEIGGVTITDAQMNSLREAGLAQTFTMVGQSSQRNYTGVG